MAFAMKYTILQQYLPVPTNRRRGAAISPAVKFVVAHDTGNAGSTARGNVHYFATSPTISASAHLFVDDREIIECVPALTGPPEKAWHVVYGVKTDNAMFGYNANDAAIGVEYCFGGGINADEAYLRYVWVIALICYRFGLDPSSAVVGHFMLDPARKTDPLTGLAQSRRTYDQLLRDVVTEYRDCTSGKPTPAQPDAVPTQLGQVRTTFALNIRKGGPNRGVPVDRVVSAGTRLNFVAKISNGEPINGNANWYKDEDGYFFWSGATRPE